MTEETQGAADPGEALGVDDAPQLTELEAVAVDLGWKPKDQFAGDENEWRPAAEYLRRVKTPRKASEEIRDLKRTMDRMVKAQGSMMSRALEEQRSDIESRFAQAVENKDAQGAAKAAADMRKLEADNAPEPEQSPDDVFRERNPWYEKNAKATALAIGISQQLVRKGITGEEMFKQIEDAVREDYPDLFDGGAAKPRHRPSAVAPPSRGGGSREKGYGDLPDAARRAADSFAESVKMRFPNRDIEAVKKQYAKDFWAEQAA